MPAVRTQSHPTLAATPSPYGARSRTAKAVPLNGDASCLLGVETARDANTQVDADVGDPLGPQVDDPGELCPLTARGKRADPAGTAPSRATAYPTTLPTRSRFRLEGGRAVTGHQWKVCFLSLLRAGGAADALGLGSCRLLPHILTPRADTLLQVYDFILRIPPGRVTTYALISSALGSSSQAGPSLVHLVLDRKSVV